jgi:2-methylcitrate dehydratase PrpD
MLGAGSELRGAPGAVTRRLAGAASDMSYASLAPDALRIVRHCLLDWLGVTLAGAAEPAAAILLEELHSEGSGGPCTIIGSCERLGARAAALANGTASHVLDYDDVNIALPGHPSVAVIPGLLALAEQRGASGQEFAVAFAAGYDVACRLGAILSPGHYAAGFHPTGTIGSVGAAAACGRLLGLDLATMAACLGIASTQAAGLKGLFGTMCKPLHAGKAASNGILAARLAARGFASRPDAIECEQGFAPTHSRDFHPERDREDREPGHWLRSNLFKYHAACYLTHAPIDVISGLRRSHRFAPGDVARVEITVHESCAGVCHIPSPTTGLEAKFSLRATAAMALRGDDTSGLYAFTDEKVNDPELVALRDRVEVGFSPVGEMTQASVSIHMKAGGLLHAQGDSGRPAVDLDEQERRLCAKFLALATPVLGLDRAERLRGLALKLDSLPDVGVLAAAAALR